VAAALADRGDDGLFDALRDSPRVGFIRTPDNLSYNIRFARSEQTTYGRRIVLAVDRVLTFWSSARSAAIEYPFTVIELRLDRDSRGEGKMSLTTRVVCEGAGMIALEDYANEPIRLEAVRTPSRAVP
jgi:hypothetical protein